MKNKNLYIILGLLGVGGLIWYFKRKQTNTALIDSTAKDINNLSQTTLTQPTRSEGVVLTVRNNIVESPTTITPTSDVNYLSLLNNQNLNYNWWFSELKAKRFINKFYQNTKETQPLPFTPEGITIPLAKGWIFEWLDFDFNAPQGLINQDIANAYHKRWIIKFVG